MTEQLESDYDFLEVHRRQDDLSQILKFVLRFEEEDREFMKVRGWERRFIPEEVERAKIDFLSLGPTYIQKARWRVGLFDCVGEYFTIGELSVKNTFVHGEPLALPFAITFQRQCELVPVSSNLVYTDWRVSMGADIGEHAVAWRPCFTATPLETLAGRLRCCWYSMPSLEPLSAELHAYGLDQVWPYGAGKEVSGVQFDTNKWRPLGAKVKGDEEGIVLLTKQGTHIRVWSSARVNLEDYHPFYKGIWEYEYFFGTLKPRRYRCGPVKQTAAYLAQIAIISDLTFPERHLPLLMKTEGEMGQVVEVKDRIVVIDTCVRPRRIEKVCGDVVTGFLGGKEFRYPVGIVATGETVVGSKAVLTVDGRHFLFKDKQKKWDLIGGTVEANERSIDTLIREIREEAGIEAQEKDLRYLGISVDGLYYSFVYQWTLPELPEGQWRLYERVAVSDCVPWAMRLLTFAIGQMVVSSPRLCEQRSDRVSLTPKGRELLSKLDSWIKKTVRIGIKPSTIMGAATYFDFKRVWGYCVIVGVKLLAADLTYDEYFRLGVSLAKEFGVPIVGPDKMLQVLGFLGDCVRVGSSPVFMSMIGRVRKGECHTFEEFIQYERAREFASNGVDNT